MLVFGTTKPKDPGIKEIQHREEDTDPLAGGFIQAGLHSFSVNLFLGSRQQVSGLQDYRVARLQGYRVTRLQGEETETECLKTMGYIAEVYTAGDLS